MTKLLLKLFLKNKPVDNNDSRSTVGKLSGAVGIVFNILLCVFKLIVGSFSGSISITADAMNNLSDASGSVVTFLGFKLAEKPADPDHPYGHARFEYLSGLGVAALIILIGFELAKSSVLKIINPTPVRFSVPLLVVLVLSILAKLWLYLFNKKLSHIIDSATLAATAADSRNDVIATSAVLISAFLEHKTGFHADGVSGLFVALFILFSGISLAKETISPLLGENASPEIKAAIISTVTAHEKVLGFHDLMVHDYGPNQRFASLHVEMDSKEDPMLCHGIIDELERQCLKNHGVNLVIHYDPIVRGDKRLDELKSAVFEYLSEIDKRLTFHDFRIVDGADYTNLIFDVALPFDLDEKTVKAELDRRLNDRGDKKYFTVITFDCEAFNTNSK
ncbi:MAG: cation transporter [Ruminococcaceae bacterium]|nr:cation transporter [Oscillospiraceae bacterium]